MYSVARVVGKNEALGGPSSQGNDRHYQLTHVTSKHSVGAPAGPLRAGRPWAGSLTSFTSCRAFFVSVSFGRRVPAVDCRVSLYRMVPLLPLRSLGR